MAGTYNVPTYSNTLCHSISEPLPFALRSRHHTDKSFKTRELYTYVVFLLNIL